MHCAYAGHTSNILKSDFVSLFAEEEGGDLVQPGISFPGPAKEDLGRVHTSAAQSRRAFRAGATCTSVTGDPPRKMF